jgi:Ni/Co efflux regulator RcnB
MRKFLIAALAATSLVPTAATAQSRHEIRHDRREIRRDVKRHDYREARKDRRELREDWRQYRRAHRNIYHRPAYVAPRGYRYNRVSVGYHLAPAFWGRPYWVDYGYYRLPAPPRGMRYIRYGNDVLLVSMRSGRVIAVYDNFFW